ncbi:MAG: hypothetical protein GY744_11025 [Gammaproteobacteria bacterium]|nr:hypothetical protein [Gammaproteobacteria bacterium]
MKKTSLLLTACAALFASNIAFAEPPEFKGADKNSDGGVDAAEFKALNLEKDFAELDADKNGNLNKTEYEAALEEECD